MIGVISKEENKSVKINTTLGELVDVISQIALKAGKTESEGYKLAALAVEDILKRKTSSKETSDKRKTQRNKAKSKK